MRVSLIGIGPGNPELLTGEARALLRDCDAVVGARRILDALPEDACRNRVEAVASDKIALLLEAHPEWAHVSVVLSGDVGFYSGARALSARLDGCELDAHCGVSSVQLLCARLLRPWQSLHLVSGHGLALDPLPHVLNYPECFFLTDAVNTPGAIARALTDAGLGDAQMTVGERLSYPDERITQGTASALADKSFGPLNAVIVDSSAHFCCERSVPGLPDEAFERGSVPMTKQEVRASALAKLALRPADVVWDIGAGTGSVSVECALACRFGRVFAIECEPDALALIERNRQKFAAHNLTVVAGKAPEALEGLLRPDAAFIGGSKGTLNKIINNLLKINPEIRIVISAISLDTLSEALACAKEYALGELDIAQIAVSRSRTVGPHHMLSALNPIFLVSAQGGAAK